MTHPSSGSSGRIRFKSSHRRVTLKISHRRMDSGGAAERDFVGLGERDRYIAPPKKFRR